MSGAWRIATSQTCINSCSTAGPLMMCITNNLIFYDCNTGLVGKANKEPVRQSNLRSQIDNQPPSTMFVSKALSFWYMVGDVRDEQWFLPDTAQLVQPFVLHFVATSSTRVEVTGLVIHKVMKALCFSCDREELMYYGSKWGGVFISGWASSMW